MSHPHGIGSDGRFPRTTCESYQSTAKAKFRGKEQARETNKTRPVITTDHYKIWAD
jgi:hypothetical protein